MRALGWGILLLVGCAGSTTGEDTDASRPTADGGRDVVVDGGSGGTDGCAACGDEDAGPDGGCEGSGCVPPTPARADDLFVDLPPTGSVLVTLWPGETVTPGAATVVAFGAPFPRGVVDDAARLRVVDASGAELPSRAETLIEWRSLGDTALEGGIRAALVHVEVSFDTLDPLEVRVVWGEARSRELPPQPDPTDAWVLVDGDDYPASAGVREPPVYATYSPEWLGQCLLRTRTVPFGDVTELSWFDEVVPQFGRTAVNDVDPRVTPDNRIDYLSGNEPWLFDRALTLFGIYERSGELEWLRHAHRAAQYYASHIGSDGTFDLKPGDLKYAYGQPMLVDLMLVGDRSLLDPIERVASAGEDWPELYETTRNFWTERHQTYALLAALSAWEATGNETYAARVREVVDATVLRVREPASSSWPADGCLLHTMRAHEGVADDRPICSPWMTALLGDALFRYYVHSEDERALELLAGLADYVRETGIYDGVVEHPNLDGVMVPWYLASSVYQFTDSGAWADLEHTCDVAGLAGRGAWAQDRLGRDSSAAWETTEQLLAACQQNLDNWHRPGGPEAGLAEWRLAPPRKLNWWFGTTSDVGWLLSTR